MASYASWGSFFSWVPEVIRRSIPLGIVGSRRRHDVVTDIPRPGAGRPPLSTKL